MEQYLSIIENSTVRRTLSQYRLSNHKLQIERGRYENIPQDERIYRFCNSGEVENEYHFALTCQKYEDLRINSDNILKKYFYFKNTWEGKQKLFQHAMSSDDPVLIYLLAKFIFLCYTIRADSLKSIED